MKFGDLRARRVDELGIGVGVTRKAPSTIDCLSQQNPSSTRIRLVARCSRDQRRELLDDRELLVSIQCAKVGQYLNPNVFAVAIHVRNGSGRKIVHERGRVLSEHRDIGHLLDGHQRVSKFRRERLRIVERSRRRVDVDHRHATTRPGMYVILHTYHSYDVLHSLVA